MCGYILIEFGADLRSINFIGIFNWDYNILLLCLDPKACVWGGNCTSRHQDVCGCISIEFSADLGLINFIANWDYILLLCVRVGFEIPSIITKRNLIM